MNEWVVVSNETFQEWTFREDFTFVAEEIIGIGDKDSSFRQRIRKEGSW